MRTDYALIGSPLSVGYRGRLEKSLQTVPKYLPLGELRRLSPTKLVRTLVTLNAERLLLPVEDEDSYAFLPAALALASVSNARHIVIVRPDLVTEAIPRWRASARIVGTVAASVSGVLATS